MSKFFRTYIRQTLNLVIQTIKTEINPPLSHQGHGGVLPPQNSVGSSGYSPGFRDAICRPHSSMAALFRHPLHCHLRLGHHHRHCGLLYWAVCLGALRLRENPGRLICVFLCQRHDIHLLEACCFFRVWVIFILVCVVTFDMCEDKVKEKQAKFSLDNKSSIRMYVIVCCTWYIGISVVKMQLNFCCCWPHTQMEMSVFELKQWIK